MTEALERADAFERAEAFERADEDLITKARFAKNSAVESLTGLAARRLGYTA